MDAATEAKSLQTAKSCPAPATMQSPTALVASADHIGHDSTPLSLAAAPSQAELGPEVETPPIEAAAASAVNSLEVLEQTTNVSVRAETDDKMADSAAILDETLTLATGEAVNRMADSTAVVDESLERTPTSPLTSVSAASGETRSNEAAAASAAAEAAWESWKAAKVSDVLEATTSASATEDTTADGSAETTAVVTETVEPLPTSPPTSVAAAAEKTPLTEEAAASAAQFLEVEDHSASASTAVLVEAVESSPSSPDTSSIRGPVTCTCGHTLPLRANFCGKCGAQYKPYVPARRATMPAVVDSRQCPDFLSAVKTPQVKKPWKIRVDTSSGRKLGMSVGKKELVVESVKEGELIDEWNKLNPELALLAGYRIVKVNGFTSSHEIVAECKKPKALVITVEAPEEHVQKRAHGTMPAGSKELEKLRQQQAEEMSKERTVEVNEMQPLKIGPFGAGVACEILDASYGYDDKQHDVTNHIRELWVEGHETGLYLRNNCYNAEFGVDPAPLRLKKVKVTYRLHNVRHWDVSRGSYTEGASKMKFALPMMAKAMANVVGLTVAASGYALGKAETNVKNYFGNAEADATLADSSVFQSGFMAWLKLNGIFPQVEYEGIVNPDSGKLGVQTGRAERQFRNLRKLNFPDEDPLDIPPADDMRQTPLLVCNHICYIDGVVLAAVFDAPKVIAMAGTKKTPIIGTFADEIGVIEVDRENKDSRAATLAAITNHVDEWRPGARPLLLFPEGKTSNGDDLLEFKKGAFVPGQPVRPVVMCYTGNWHPANVNFKTGPNGEIEPTSDSEWYEQFLGHMVHSLQIKVLPPYLPTQQEQEQPELYGKNVRELMSAAYLKLKEECEQERKKAEENTWRNWSRRTYSDLSETMGKLLGGTIDVANGESDGEPQRPSGGYGSRGDRRRSQSEQRDERRRSREQAGQRRKARKSHAEDRETG